MTTRERYNSTIQYFLTHAPNAETELIYDNTYELLVSVILSAQCTDKRVNLTTPAIFSKFPDIVSLSHANEKDDDAGGFDQMPNPIAEWSQAIYSQNR